MIPLYKMQGKKFREQRSNSMVTQAAKKAGSRDPYGHWVSGLRDIKCPDAWLLYGYSCYGFRLLFPYIHLSFGTAQESPL